MKEISLTQNKIALVDDNDFDWLSTFNWAAIFHKPSGNWYARRFTKADGTIIMARFIMDAQKGQIIDHKDHDTLNNQRSNLRVATVSLNGANRRKGRSNTSSLYKGVHWYTAVGKWKAVIRKNGEAFFLGHFEDEVGAALAYDNKALELFGEFAHLNFPERNRDR